MASAKQGYPVVIRMLAQRAPAPVADRRRAARALPRRSCARRVHAVDRLTPTIVEVVVQAPAAARAFRPGQFYRLQNYEMRSRRARRRRDRAGDGRPGADRRLGRPERGPALASSCWRWAARPTCARMLQPGEPVVLMGPTGTPTEIHAGETVAAGRRRPRQRGAVLDRPGAARGGIEGDLLRRLQEGAATATRSTEIERAADVIVWCCDEAPGFAPTPAAGPQLRRQHRARRWRPTAPASWASRRSRSTDADRIIAIGSDR